MVDVLASNGLGRVSADIVKQVYTWDFNVFELSDRVGGRPLFTVTMALLEDQGLLDGWLLDRPVVEAYLRRVESMYKPNPYHNNTHAADVTQTAGVIMASLDAHLRSRRGSNSSSSSCSNSHSPPNSFGCFSGCCGSSSCSGRGGAAAAAKAAASSAAPGGPRSASASSSPSADGCGEREAEGGLSKLERFAIILASAVHDLGHPGVNNAYLVRTRDPMALTYNDRSVNEMMHASLAFKLALEHDDLNLFARFEQADFETLRKLVLEMVLSTDMDVHFALLKRFDDGLRDAPDVATWTSLEQRSLLFQMLVHLADLANPSRPWHLALKWAEWVVTEFMAQGDREALAHIPVSPPCDRSKVCMPAAQLFFIERFMAPTLECFKSVAPSFYAMANPWLDDTTSKWSSFKAAGVTLPLVGYPHLPPRHPSEAGRLWTSLGGGPQCCGACAPLAGQKQQHQQPQQLAQPPPQLKQQAAQAAG